mgnify:CR=1 FL=1
MKTQSFALLVVAVMATPSAADTLTKADGTVVSDVTVLSETYESVEYRVKDSRAKRSINAAEVRSIDYSRTNADYREGVAALVKGDTILAATLYVRAAEDKKIPAAVIFYGLDSDFFKICKFTVCDSKLVISTKGGTT